MAWNEPGNGKRDPWGSGNRKPSGKSPLEAIQKSLRGLLGKPGRLPANILIGMVVLLIVGMLLSSYTVIEAQQVGVVTRFGEVVRTLEPGFHFKLPQPFETVDKVDAERVRSVSDSVTLLTRDVDNVTVEFTVQYQIDDVRKYLFSLSDPDSTVQAVTEAAVTAVIGRNTMDKVLTDTSAAQDARQVVQKALDGYQSGLRIDDISFQAVSPPSEVKDAFDDVRSAREDKQGSEDSAHAYASKLLPAAQGDAARIAAQASSYKAERIAHAEGDTARFNLILAQYKAAPEVTRRRLWLETMEQVLANNPKVIDGSDGHNVINLPSVVADAAPSGGGGTGAGMTPATDAATDAGDKGKQP